MSEVDARELDLARTAEAFCEASIRDWTGRAARMLADTPQLAGYDFATAVVLGDATRVRHEIEHDPAIATRPGARTGWTPLHAVCGSRWHRLDPARADGLLAVARLLLDAGADPAARTAGPGRRGGAGRGRSALGCATACASGGAANLPVIRLLLERGAVPDDHDLYLASFAEDAPQCLRLLLEHVPSMTASTALAAPLSTGNVEAVRVLLEAGADPNRPLPRDDGKPPWPALYAAVTAGADVELAELLLARGAQPDAPGPDGRSPHQVATSLGRTDLTALLRRYGAADDATQADRFLSACLRADRAEAQQQLARHPGLVSTLTDAERGMPARAAQDGRTEAVRLMLELGFPPDARGGDDGGTALHGAAFSGNVDLVRLLLAAGADIEARDATFGSSPLDWAIVGSGDAAGRTPAPDWVGTVRALIEAGAATQDVTLSPDDPKPPSQEVAGLLRGYGIGAARE